MHRLYALSDDDCCSFLPDGAVQPARQTGRHVLRMLYDMVPGDGKGNGIKLQTKLPYDSYSYRRIDGRY